MADVQLMQSRENMELDFQRSRARHISSGSGHEFEDESLDPRVQVELEKLNKGSDEINRLELELDEARACFRQALSDSTQKLNTLTKKLGSCIEKARPYYDARMRAKEAQVETQRAALRFERAMSMHEAAKEMVQLAELGYMNKGEPFDPAWQEMLNHATMKVNEAEKERIESGQEHQLTAKFYNEADQKVQLLQKDLKRAITKSSFSTRRSLLQLNNIVNQHELELLPYFEMKGKFNHLMEDQKQLVAKLEAQVVAAKSMYSDALRNLEAISDEIHRQRMERRSHKELGIRSAGVGAESPSPPPTREGGGKVDGSDTVIRRSSFNNGVSNDSISSLMESVTGHEVRHSGEFLSSIIYSSPEMARSDSYRQAIDALSKSPTCDSFNSADYDENFDVPSLEDEYMSLPSSHSPRVGRTDVLSNERVVVGPIAEEDGDTVFSTSPKTCVIIEERENSPVPGSKQALSSSPSSSTGSPSGTRKSKLQGLILRIDSSMDSGLRHPSYNKPQRTQSMYSTAPQYYRGLAGQSMKKHSDNNNASAGGPANVGPRSAISHPLMSNSGRTGQLTQGSPKVTSPPLEGNLNTASPVKQQTTLELPRPASSQDLEDTSDTESIASTGPMLDDELVEMATLELPDEATLELEEIEFRQTLERNDWKRRSLPPHLSYLKRYISQDDSETESAVPKLSGINQNESCMLTQEKLGLKAESKVTDLNETESSTSVTTLEAAPSESQA